MNNEFKIMKHFLKRTNINEDDITSPLEESNIQQPIQPTIEEIVTAMQSKDEDRQLSGMQAARKMLSRKRNPPIDLMIGHGVVPICVGFLQKSDNPMLQLEAAWALSNIAYGTSEQTRCVIDHNAVPHLCALLKPDSINLAEAAVWALANIAGDGAAARDIVIQNRAVDGILTLINSETPLSGLRHIVWLMSNLCDNKNPSPPFEEIRRLLPVLSHLLSGNDVEVLAKACWTLSYVTLNDDQIQAVVDTYAVPRLVALLGNDEPSIIEPALYSVSNIVAGTDSQRDAVISAGGLSKLATLLSHPENYIVEEAAYAVGNITAGNQEQIQAVIDSGAFQQIRNVLEKGDIESQKEAAWAVTNAITSGSPSQVVELIVKYQILKPFCDLLEAKDPCTIKVVLKGLYYLLATAKKLGAVQNLCSMVDEVGGVDKLQALEGCENEGICQKVYAIIRAYFDGDDACFDGDDACFDSDDAENDLAP